MCAVARGKEVRRCGVIAQLDCLGRDPVAAQVVREWKISIKRESVMKPVCTSVEKELDKNSKGGQKANGKETEKA